MSAGNGAPRPATPPKAKQMVDIKIQVQVTVDIADPLVTEAGFRKAVSAQWPAVLERFVVEFKRLKAGGAVTTDAHGDGG